MSEWLDVSDITPRIGYTATASQTAFTVPFVFFENSDLLVYKNDVLLTLGVHYTVTGAEDVGGGMVTLATGATLGDAIQIARHVPIEQTTHIPPSGPLDVGAINIQISKLIAIDQQTDNLLSRTLRQPDSEATVDMELPSTRANKILGFDSAGAPVAVLGPSFVSDDFVGAALVESKAVAQVTTFGGTTNLLLIGGDTAAGDMQVTAYVHGTGTGSFTDAAGTHWKPVSNSNLSVPVPGAVGDGTVDDRAAIQSVMNAVAAAGGGDVHLSAKTFRILINSGVTDHGLIIPNGVRLLLNGAALRLECTGNVFGVRLQSNTAIIGPGTIATAVSASLSSGQSIYHTPITLGSAYGDYPTVGSLNAYASPSNWKISNLTITNVRADTPTPGGAMIAIYGGANHGIIEDITIPDNATVGIAIGMDWMPVGTIDVTNLSTTNATKTAFNAGTAYTLHPHDIEVRRIGIGNMSVANTGTFGGHGIRLSGCYAIRVDGVTIAGSTYAGIFHTAGDVGFEFAPAAVKNMRYKGTSFNNVRIESANNGWGIFSDCYADNIALRVLDGYVNMLSTQGETDLLFDNVLTQGSLTSLAWPGFRIQNQQGGELRNCKARYHSVGVLVETNCDRLKIIGGTYDSNWLHGIHCLSGDAAEDLQIIAMQAFSNGQGAGAADAGVYLQVGIRPVVRDCIIGGVGGDSFQDFGIRCAGSQDAIIEDNYIVSHVAGGAGVSIGTSSDIGVGALLAKLSGTRFGSSVTTKYGGANVIPHDYRIDLSGNKILECSVASGSLAFNAPTSGTWTRGSRIFYTDPSASGKIGVVCVTAGSPGTWKPFGAIDA
ncbi:hypothetical protein IVB03_39565 [Bradyrhizobium sp. 168]|uniref:hypothetical protein n=1 Tax=Bradyrhizobium sp. 168 TaxID=2782639 RepID=UPI001FFB1627|nr:hypothetical protein [Bradyrhizobium sp. 168]MCK1585495.1 hypothetical protein [Bradyrhizobium sp. 168]